MFKEVRLGSKLVCALRELQEKSQPVACELDNNIALLNLKAMVHESRPHFISRSHV